MPEMTNLGWFHTIIGILALLSGAYTLAKFKVIKEETFSGKIYLSSTLIAALTALMIYNQGGFGPAHLLALLTLAALAGGFLVSKIMFLARFSPYLKALCFSSTILFHMIPAITDALRRLPLGNPVVDRFDHPLLMQFYLLFVGLFALGYLAQVMWLRNQKSDA